MRPLLIAVLLCACSCADPSVGYVGRTTDGALARANLEARFGALNALRKRGSTNPAIEGELIEARLMRARYFGVHGGLVSARDAVDADADDPRRLELAARVAGAVHEFAEAERLLERAESIDGRARAEERSTIDLARGDHLAEVLRGRQERAAARPTYRSLVDLAAALAAVGRFERADATYVRALRIYHDVSPFPVAYVQFQRGVMWSEMAGQPERAIPLYEDAVERLPDYVVANVHLAELEEADAAIERLRRIAGWSDDPEPASVLAELLAERDPEAALVYRERATSAYEALLTRLPNAYADHAAEHFLGAGADTERAWQLASAQVHQRDTDRHIQLAIDAAIASGHHTAACELAATGQSRVRVPLRTLSREVLATCSEHG